MTQPLLRILGGLGVILFGAGCFAQPGADDRTKKLSSSVPAPQIGDQALAGAGGREEYPGHIVNPGRAELHAYLAQMKLSPSVRGCEEWSSDAARHGMVLAVPGASRLFVGKPQPGGGVDEMERNYEVTSASIGGSPVQGQVMVRLEPAELQREQGCLEQLKGMSVEWGSPGLDGSQPAHVGDLLVDDVRFLRAERLDRFGRVVPTGDFLVALDVSEPWLSMVVRELRAHVWGILGSALLMAAAGTAGWVVRNRRIVIRHARRWQHLVRAGKHDAPSDEARC